jgi:S1-C subfamily serine protease
LVEQLHRDLAGAPVAEFLKARVRDATPSQIPSVVERYLAQMGPVATPERKETVLVKREGGTELWIRYELPRDAYDRALAFYKQTKTVQGMTVARVFPLLETASHPRGDLVILGVEKGKAAVFATLHEGDVLLSVNDRALQTPEQLERVLAETMQTTPIGGTVSLQVEAGGAVRTVKLPRLP